MKSRLFSMLLLLIVSLLYNINSSIAQSFYTDGVNLYATIKDGTYLVKDNGKVWEKCSFVIKKNHFASNGKIMVNEHKGNANISTDMGKTWNPLTGYHTFLDKVSEVNMADPISIITLNGDDIIIGIANFLIRSSDNGATWTKITGIKFHRTTEIFVLAFDGNTIYAGGTGNAVYISKNNGSTWKKSYKGFKKSNDFRKKNQYGWYHFVEKINDIVVKEGHVFADVEDLFGSFYHYNKVKNKWDRMEFANTSKADITYNLDFHQIRTTVTSDDGGKSFNLSNLTNTNEVEFEFAHGIYRSKSNSSDIMQVSIDKGQTWTDYKFMEIIAVQTNKVKREDQH